MVLWYGKAAFSSLLTHRFGLLFFDSSRFHKRRAELRSLTAEFRNGLGGARIDEDGRLVRALGPPQPPRANLPPPVGNGNNGIGEGDNINNNPNADENHDNPHFFPDNILDQQPENQEELFFEQQRRETEATISHAVKELRSRNHLQRVPVPEEDFEVILLSPRGRPSRPRATTQGVIFGTAQNHNNIDEEDEDTRNDAVSLSLRRIAVACFVVLAAIVGTMLQLLPIGALLTGGDSLDPRFDALLGEVLDIREWRDHVRECGPANRGGRHHDNDNNWEWLRTWMRRSAPDEKTSSDCSGGVLHVPSKPVLRLDSIASSVHAGPDLSGYFHGVNVSWFVPCSGHPSVKPPKQCKPRETAGSDGPADSKHSTTCRAPQRNLDRCFRGIHDNLIENKEIHAAIRMGDALIFHGGDHFDVHHDVHVLYNMVPSIVKKTKKLLDSTYFNQRQESQNARNDEKSKPDDGDDNTNDRSSINHRHVEPVAFRVLTTGPMDGHNVKLAQDGDLMTMYLAHSTALNETNYLDWVLESRRHNDRARYQAYYRPWPYRLRPKRETCDLKFDLEADSRFCVLTSLYLNGGEGGDYRGGSDLFVDDHPSNFVNPSHRIARGISIDGSRGRLVVSTGGFENLRCRFPTHYGFRTVLQIWWDCQAP